MPTISGPTPDATTTTKGKIQLAGDLTGTASSPTIANLAVTAAKIEVQQAWIPVTFKNSWVDFGSTSPPCAYMKDSLGFVHLRGLAKNGTMGQPIFTLPAGYRPAFFTRFITVSNGVAAPVDLSQAGDYAAFSPGTNASVSLDNVTFKAEA